MFLAHKTAISALSSPYVSYFFAAKDPCVGGVVQSLAFSLVFSHLWFNTPWSLPEKTHKKKTSRRRQANVPVGSFAPVRVDFWCISTKWLRMTSESSAGWGGSTWTVTLQLHVLEIEIEHLRVSGISCTSIKIYSTSCFQKNGV